MTPAPGASVVPDLSVVVVTYRSADHIEACLSALPAATKSSAYPAVTYDVVVVDNASPDDTVDVLRALGGVDQLVELELNLGFAAGVNEGLARATGEFVVLLNPDAIAHPGSLAAAVAFARRHPHRRLYGARTFDSEGRPDLRAAWGLPSPWSLFCFATGLSTVLRRSGLFNPEGLGSWQRDDTRDVGALSGCCLLARRDFLEDLGGLDASFFMYSEDIDLAVRARKKGATPVVVPDAHVTHIGGASSTSADKTVMVMRGRVSYLRKHWSRGRRRAGESLLLIGVAARAGGARLTGRGTKWRAVWSRRGEWRAGWGDTP